MGSLWIKVLNMGSFLTLVISGLLFFGIYGGILLLAKESLAVEIMSLVLKKFQEVSER